MESTPNDEQKKEREEKERGFAAGSGGRLKQLFDKAKSVKSKYNTAKSGYDNTNSAWNKVQQGCRRLKSGEVHPTSQTATQQLSMQAAANMVPQSATVLRA
jgi:hypothetical protein